MSVLFNAWTISGAVVGLGVASYMNFWDDSEHANPPRKRLIGLFAGAAIGFGAQAGFHKLFGAPEPTAPEMAKICAENAPKSNTATFIIGTDGKTTCSYKPK